MCRIALILPAVEHRPRAAVATLKHDILIWVLGALLEPLLHWRFRALLANLLCLGVNLTLFKPNEERILARLAQFEVAFLQSNPRLVSIVVWLSFTELTIESLPSNLFDGHLFNLRFQLNPLVNLILDRQVLCMHRLLARGTVKVIEVNAVRPPHLKATVEAGEVDDVVTLLKRDTWFRS